MSPLTSSDATNAHLQAVALPSLVQLQVLGPVYQDEDEGGQGMQQSGPDLAKEWYDYIVELHAGGGCIPLRILPAPSSSHAELAIDGSDGRC
jgi:hypothetical protein